MDEALHWNSVEGILDKESPWQYVEKTIKDGKFKDSTAKCYIGAMKVVISFLKSNYSLKLSKENRKLCISLIQDIER